MTSRVAYASLALALISTPALGQQRICAPDVKALSAKLAEKFGEHLTGAGVDANGSMVSVFSNPESGSWTMAVTRPEGTSCVVSSGEGWAYERSESPKPKGRLS